MLNFSSKNIYCDKKNTTPINPQIIIDTINASSGVSKFLTNEGLDGNKYLVLYR